MGENTLVFACRGLYQARVRKVYFSGKCRISETRDPDKETRACRMLLATTPDDGRWNVQGLGL